MTQSKDLIFNCLITQTGKDQWDNCLKIINELDYHDQVRMAPQMLFLLRNLNWPGAREACDIMTKMNIEDLTPFIKQALELADIECDTVWITWIKIFLEKLNLNNIVEENPEMFKCTEW
jgi:hypothetical protein